jgi:microcystin-dependent protein
VPKAPTARLAIQRYEDSENASFSAQVNAISEAVDAKACIFLKGKLSARPAFGIEGRYYLAEDGTLAQCAEGDLYYDTGTEWVGPRNVVTYPPIGFLGDYALGTDPVDADGIVRWLIADGRAISRATYPVLFAKIQAQGLLAIWGEGNGTTTFNIPNLVGRVAVHPGGSGVAGVGSKGGEQTHKLVAKEAGVGKHEHTPNDGRQFATAAATSTGSNAGGAPYGALGVAAATTAAASDAEEGHNNMQPYVGLFKVIRVL